MKLFSTLTYQKTKLKNNIDYLKKGKFKINKNFRTYKNGKNSLQVAERKNLTFKLKLEYLFARLFYCLKVKANGSKFNADVVYFATVSDEINQDIKFFDSKKKIVLTKCNSTQRVNLFKKNKPYFSKYFNMPKTLSFCEEEKYYIEEIIEKKEINNDNLELIFDNLFNVYTDYYEKDGIEKEVIEDKTYYRQHGDLSIDNIILSKEDKVYLIDFDFSGYYPPFYDVIFCAVELSISRKNGFGIELLKKEKYKKYFNKFYGDGAKSCINDFAIIYLKNRVKGVMNKEKEKYYTESLKDIVKEF